MKEKPLPNFPTDEMSVAERLNVQKVLLGSYEPANSEDLSHFCDCCSNLCNLLGAIVMEGTAYRGSESPISIFFTYRHLLINIRHFNHVKMDMIARQYVSIYPDYQKEMNESLLKLNTAIVDFLAMPINSNPEVLVKLLAEDDFCVEEDYFKSDLQLQYLDIVIKVLPELVQQVIVELEQQLMKNQEKHVRCRSLRSKQELSVIFNNNNAYYLKEVFPMQLQKEESFINQSILDSGKSRSEVLHGRYDDYSKAFIKSIGGCVYFTFLNNKDEMIDQLMKMGFGKDNYDDFFSYTCMMEYIGNGIKQQQQEEEIIALELQNMDLTDEVTFTSTQAKELVMNHLPIVISYLCEKKSVPMDWVCLYQTLLFYKLIKPVHFLNFYRWICDQTEKELFSYENARYLCTLYFVKNAGKWWSVNAALQTKNTNQMAKKVKDNNEMVQRLAQMIRFGVM